MRAGLDFITRRLSLQNEGCLINLGLGAGVGGLVPPPLRVKTAVIIFKQGLVELLNIKIDEDLNLNTLLSIFFS